MTKFSELVSKLNELFAPVLALSIEAAKIRAQQEALDYWNGQADEWRRLEVLLDKADGQFYDLKFLACEAASEMGFSTLGSGVTRIALVHEDFPSFVFKVEYQQYNSLHSNTNEKELTISRNFPAARPYIARTYIVRGVVAIQERLIGKMLDSYTKEYTVIRRQLEDALTKAGLQVNDLHNENFLMTATGPRALDLGGFQM